MRGVCARALVLKGEPRFGTNPHGAWLVFGQQSGDAGLFDGSKCRFRRERRGPEKKVVPADSDEESAGTVEDGTYSSA